MQKLEEKTQTALKSGKVLVDAVADSDGTVILAFNKDNTKNGSLKITYNLGGRKYKAVVNVIK